jgi:hypothetical protein
LELFEGVEVFGQAAGLGPAGVKIFGVGWAVGEGDAEAVDDAEDVFEVVFAEAGAVEVIDAKQEATVGASQAGVEQEVGRVTQVKEAGGSGGEADKTWRG